MITVRPAAERGRTQIGWLDSRHTFAFGGYRDPEHTGFRSLRVINEDWVAPGQGFGTHPHRDMEIVSLVLDGAMAHRDSMGNGSTITPGTVQRMTAGSGLTHSEVNPSPDETLHLLQIWLPPERRGLTPSWEEKEFPPEARRNRLQRIVAREPVNGELAIHQDASLHLAALDAGAEVHHPLAENRHAWLQVIAGEVRLGEHTLTAGDGAAISGEDSVTVRAESEAEILLFDLA